MTSRRHIAALAAAALLMAAPETARAGDHPHDRNGFLLGFNLGGGSAEVEWETEDATLSSDRESGGAGNLRLGYAVSPAVALGLEVAGWSRTYDVVGPLGGSSEVTVTFGIVGGAATWYPGRGGFFVRGAVGAGRIEVDVESGDVTVTADETGIGLLAATGYEWRLSRVFALGAELDLGHVNAGEVEGAAGDSGDLTANFANLTAALNFYFD